MRAISPNGSRGVNPLLHRLAHGRTPWRPPAHGGAPEAAPRPPRAGARPRWRCARVGVGARRAGRGRAAHRRLGVAHREPRPPRRRGAGPRRGGRPDRPRRLAGRRGGLTGRASPWASPSARRGASARPSRSWRPLPGACQTSPWPRWPASSAPRPSSTPEHRPRRRPPSPTCPVNRAVCSPTAHAGARRTPCWRPATPAARSGPSGSPWQANPGRPRPGRSPRPRRRPPQGGGSRRGGGHLPRPLGRLTGRPRRPCSGSRPARLAEGRAARCPSPPTSSGWRGLAASSSWPSRPGRCERWPPYRWTGPRRARGGRSCCARSPSASSGAGPRRRGTGAGCWASATRGSGPAASSSWPGWQ